MRPRQDLFVSRCDISLSCRLGCLRFAGLAMPAAVSSIADRSGLSSPHIQLFWPDATRVPRVTLGSVCRVNERSRMIGSPWLPCKNASILRQFSQDQFHVGDDRPGIHVNRQTPPVEDLQANWRFRVGASSSRQRRMASIVSGCLRLLGFFCFLLRYRIGSLPDLLQDGP